MKDDCQFTKADGVKLEERLTRNLTNVLTKNLTNVLTKNLTNVLTKNLTEVIDAKLAGEIAKLKFEMKDEQTKFLSEMHDIVDGLAIEVKNNDEFREITTGKIKENTSRIGKLEKKVFGVARA